MCYQKFIIILNILYMFSWQRGMMLDQNWGVSPFYSERKKIKALTFLGNCGKLVASFPTKNKMILENTVLIFENIPDYTVAQLVNYNSTRIQLCWNMKYLQRTFMEIFCRICHLPERIKLVYLCKYADFGSEALLSWFPTQSGF